jgi:hypothetical protein
MPPGIGYTPNIGLAPQQQEENDLWDQLAAFEFSKLSKEDKKQALNLALMASGGAMLSAPTFMQGLGAAGQTFAGAYDKQLSGLRAEKRDEDELRYKSMLSEAQRADEVSRFERQQAERERANKASEESVAERTGIMEEANVIRQKQADAAAEADRFSREEVERQRQIEEEGRRLVQEMTKGMGPDIDGDGVGDGLLMTPQELAQSGIDLQPDSTQGISWYAGVPMRLNPETGMIEKAPITDEASAAIDERLAMTEAGRESNLVSKKIKENNAVIADLNSRAFEDGQPPLRGADRAAAINRMEELRKENEQLRQTLMTLGMGQQDGLTEAERAFLIANGINPDELEE